jgi:hypothetical protein
MASIVSMAHGQSMHSTCVTPTSVKARMASAI